MNTNYIAIPESEYQWLQQDIQELENQLAKKNSPTTDWQKRSWTILDFLWVALKNSFMRNQEQQIIPNEEKKTTNNFYMINWNNNVINIYNQKN